MNIRRLIEEIFAESRMQDSDKNLGLVWAIMKTETIQMTSRYRWRSLYREEELNPDENYDYRVTTNFQHVLNDMVWWAPAASNDFVNLRRIDYIAAGQFEDGATPFAYRTLSTTNQDEPVTYVYPFPNGSMASTDVVKVNGYIYPELALDSILNPVCLADVIRLATLARLTLGGDSFEKYGSYASLAKLALLEAVASEPTRQVIE